MCCARTPNDPDGAPWLYTGDIARMDADGYLDIVDRKKELIKVGGFQVWPRDIEEALKQHPKVLKVAAAVCRSVAGRRDGEGLGRAEPRPDGDRSRVEEILRR